MGWHLDQVLFAVDQIVGPGHVHQLDVQKQHNVVQRFFHLKKTIRYSIRNDIKGSSHIWKRYFAGKKIMLIYSIF